MNAKIRNLAEIGSLFTDSAPRWPDPSQMTAADSRVYIIEPDLASYWLGFNTRNRTSKPGHLEDLKALLRAGKWKLVSSAISFTRAGVMTNGQHRLTACVETGLPIQCMVMFGMEDDSFMAEDKGKGRTAADDLGIMGEKNTTSLSSGIRAALLLQRGQYVLQPKVDSEDMRAWLIDNPAIRDFIFPGKFTHKMFGSAVFIGLRYLTWMLHPQESLIFWESLESGSNLTERSPIKALRERMIDHKASRAKLPAVDQMALAIRAWNYHLTGKKASFIRWNRSTEDFPKIL